MRKHVDELSSNLFSSLPQSDVSERWLAVTDASLACFGSALCHDAFHFLTFSA
jgi:hypothetical protein